MIELRTDPFERDRKALDLGYVNLIHEIIAKKGPESEIGKALEVALQLAIEVQEQQHLAQPSEPLQPLKKIMAEVIFGGAHQRGYELESEAILEMIRTYAESAMRADLLRQSVQDERKALDLAAIDALTGVSNRRKVDETLNQWLKTNRESEKQLEFAVILIDVDNFKKINDTFGHLFGDEVLRKIAELLVHTFRRTDVVGRWGGEEFVVLMQATAADVEEKLNKLWQSLQSALQVSQPLQVTASIGWVMHTPGNQDSAESLITKADEAMYQAKHQGRNQVVKFDETA